MFSFNSHINVEEIEKFPAAPVPLLYTVDCDLTCIFITPASYILSSIFDSIHERCRHHTYIPLLCRAYRAWLSTLNAHLLNASDMYDPTSFTENWASQSAGVVSQCGLRRLTFGITLPDPHVSNREGIWLVTSLIVNLHGTDLSICGRGPCVLAFH
jgi:hypothetical protein